MAPNPNLPPFFNPFQKNTSLQKSSKEEDFRGHQGKCVREVRSYALPKAGTLPYRSSFLPNRSFLPPLHFCFLWHLNFGTLSSNDIDKTTISQMCLGRGSRVGGQRSSFSTWMLIFVEEQCRESLWRKQLAGWKSLLGEIFGNWHIVQSCWFFKRSFHIYFCMSKRPFRSKHSQILKPPGGGFKYFLFSHPTWGNDPIWRSYFSDGLVQHPTRSLQQYLTPWIRPLSPRLFKEGWRAARPVFTTWRFCTTGTSKFRWCKTSRFGWFLPHERRLSGPERCHAQGLDRREVKLDGWWRWPKQMQIHLQDWMPS